MRLLHFVPLLAVPLLVTGLAAQPCVRVAASSNWGETHRVTRFTPTTVAVLIPGLGRADVVCRVELYCYTRSAAAVSMPVWIYDRSPSGAPGQAIASGSMAVGTTAAAYSALLRAPVAAGADFFVVFDNAIGNLAPPVALGGTLGTHYHSPPNWSGPWGSVAWMVRVFGEQGTVQGTFTRTGSGCPGSNGTPRIGAVNTPVIGTVFQVTVEQAPPRAALVHAIGVDSLQFDLSAIGAPGCIVEQLPVITVASTAGSTGAATFRYGIRNDRALLGALLRAQWLVLDPPANPAGLIVSQGGLVTIGDF